jgi:hypothetical protein
VRRLFTLAVSGTASWLALFVSWPRAAHTSSAAATPAKVLDMREQIREP